MGWHDQAFSNPRSKSSRATFPKPTSLPCFTTTPTTKPSFMVSFRWLMRYSHHPILPQRCIVKCLIGGGLKLQKQGFYFLPILYYTPKGARTHVLTPKTVIGDPEMYHIIAYAKPDLTLPDPAEYWKIQTRETQNQAHARQTISLIVSNKTFEISPSFLNSC